jgi:AcrR family transcriptional regulator
MAKALDLRTQKTYRALIDALRSLLIEPGFDQLTVGELCERAMVRRATFYRHFSNKYDFFTFAALTIHSEYEEKSPAPDFVDEPSRYCIALIEHHLDFLEENRELAVAVMNSRAGASLIEMLSDEFAQALQTMLEEYVRKGVDLSGRPELLAQIFAGAYTRTSCWWVAQENPIPREEILASVTKLLMRLSSTHHFSDDQQSTYR